MSGGKLCFVELGTKHVSCALCAVSNDTIQNVLFFKRVNTTQTTEHIFETVAIYDELLKLIDEVETIFKITIMEIVAVFSGEVISTHLCSCKFAFDKKHRVSKLTIEKMLSTVTRTFCAKNTSHTVLDVVNKVYTIDNEQTLLNNPYKLEGKTICLNANIISIDNYFEQKFSTQLGCYKIHIKHYVDPCVAIYSLLAPNINDHKLTLIVDIGHHTTKCCAVHKRNIITTFTLPYGGYNTTQDIAENLHIPLHTAEQLKIAIETDKSEADENEKQTFLRARVLRIINTNNETITTKLHEALQAKSTIKEDQNIQEIILLGGGSQQKNIVENLQKIFNCKIDKINKTFYSLWNDNFFKKFNNEDLTTENIQLISAIHFYNSNLEAYNNASRGFFLKKPSKITCFLRDILY